LEAAYERLHRLLGAARRLARPNDPLGRAARERLIPTGLSPQGIELAFRHSLGPELEPSAPDLARLVATAPAAAHIHVLLSASVFTAAHRAIALALAGSALVTVRPSRREPAFATLLSEAAPGLFAVVPALEPKAGEHVYAYGSSAALTDFRKSLPSGVVFHGHGPGFGAIVLDESACGREELAQVARAIALDTAVFDQRGCLSPRVVLVEGEPEAARRVATALAEALGTLEHSVPLGRLAPEEVAEVTRYRDASVYRGLLFAAGSGFVATAEANALRIAPVGRNLEVLAVRDAAAVLAPHAKHLTTLGVRGSASLTSRLRAIAPRARAAGVGAMQAPALDGPVDLRADPRGEPA